VANARYNFDLISKSFQLKKARERNGEGV